ncbi:NusA [Desulfamplus magnetovallimortis]|uniref:Transcription termination/antitermination protein NusA n=1 Tax=Desulfamplus magnetovallimortis TaxID=1246637 RepID=A0A1W1H8W9_9BACT|nr:transcription termination factor NusA [Desulfamplus magnetovallimortis]SLM28845.1 NusA [Desulfamplus magnetovallimortis]
MLITDVKRVIEQLSRDKGINREVLVATLKEAIESAARKKLGARADIEVHYDEKTGEVEVFQFKEVVDEVHDPDVELTLEDGLEYDPECEEGDSLGIKVDTSLFGRIAAQSAKQVIIQKMKEAERNAVYDNFIHKKGEIINGIVQRIDRGNIIVNLGQAEALLSSREQMPRENYKRGDRIRAYVLDVMEESRGAQVLLSRTHPEFLAKLFASEVPEVAESIVTIRSAAREPGIRSKIAVSSSDSDVDPVGACVGMKGNRVQSIVQELRGEKIDIVQWSPDVAKFVCNALSPAEIAKVVIDEENRSMEIIVPDEFLSIAIGKNGQNVRLACRLTGWHLDVMSMDEYSRKLKKMYSSFMRIPEITIDVAEKLCRNGFTTLKEIVDASDDALLSVSGLSEDEVVLIKKSAKQLFNSSDSKSGAVNHRRLDIKENESSLEDTSGSSGEEVPPVGDELPKTDDPLEVDATTPSFDEPRKVDEALEESMEVSAAPELDDPSNADGTPRVVEPSKVDEVS